MRFFRRSKIGAVALILLSFPAALVWITFGGKSVEAGLTSGTPVHSHSGITTGGSTLTRPNLSNASVFTLSTADDTTDFAIQTTGLFGKVATSTTLGTVGLYLDAGNVTDDGVRSPRIANYSDGANVGFDLRTATVDATDNAVVRVCAAGDCTSPTRGAAITLRGNETTSQAGLAELSAGNASDGLVRIIAGASQINIEEFDSDINLTTALNGAKIDTNMRIVSTASCATGYTRKTPNYCAKDTINAFTALVRDTCTTITLPANALLGHVRVSVHAKAAAGVAARSSLIHSFTDNTCSTIKSDSLVDAQSYEPTAYTSGIILTMDTNDIVESLTTLQLFIRFADDAGNTGSAKYMILGYYD